MREISRQSNRTSSNMKQLAYLISVLAILITSCQKPEDQNQHQPDPEPQEKPVPKPIGTYKYDGKEYPVYTALYSHDSSNILIIVSPLQSAETLTTYAMIGINASHEGKVIDIETSWHNDDYYFRYEDPIKYYSEFRKLTSGTILIKRHGNNADTFDVKADVTLPDGVEFSFEYSGPITSATL
jgi:hypothetical protein